MCPLLKCYSRTLLQFIQQNSHWLSLKVQWSPSLRANWTLSPNTTPKSRVFSSWSFGIVWAKSLASAKWLSFVVAQSCIIHRPWTKKSDLVMQNPCIVFNNSIVYAVFVSSCFRFSCYCFCCFTSAVLPWSVGLGGATVKTYSPQTTTRLLFIELGEYPVAAIAISNS